MISSLTPVRLEQAEAIVKRYVRRNLTAGACIRMAGFFPTPGAATAALCASINSQVPLTYQPLAREIIELYGGDVAAFDPPSEFGIALLSEIGHELFQEHPIGLAASWWPIVGGIAGETLETIIALELTRIVGAMTMLYCENGFAWVGSCAESQQRVRKALKTSPSRSCRSVALEIVQEARFEQGRLEASQIADTALRVPPAVDQIAAPPPVAIPEKPKRTRTIRSKPRSRRTS
jgi:hypothetical protein